MIEKYSRPKARSAASTSPQRTSSPRVNIKSMELAMARFCAYRDRTRLEVNLKMSRLGVPKNLMPEVLDKLISEGFLNEERFAVNYLLGKFRINKWGRVKIIRALKEKGVDESFISHALDQLDEEEYRQVMKKLVAKKYNALPDKNPLSKKQKTARYMTSKGFEIQLTWELIHAIVDA